MKFLLTSTNKFQYAGVESEVTEKVRSHFSGSLRELELGKLPIPNCVTILQRYLDKDAGQVLLQYFELFQKLVIMKGMYSTLIFVKLWIISKNWKPFCIYSHIGHWKGFIGSLFLAFVLLYFLKYKWAQNSNKCKSKWTQCIHQNTFQNMVQSL